MMGRTHLWVAVLLASLYLLIKGFSSNLIIPILFFLIGSLFPDIDHPKSLFGRPFKMAHLKFHQRGHFHTIYMGVFLAGLIAIGNVYYGLAFGSGYILHLFLDVLTVQGINLYPGKKIEGFIQTGMAFDSTLYYGSMATSILIIGFILFKNIF